MTANEKWKVPDSLENRAKSMKFSLKKDDMKPVLQKIAQAEDIDISARQIGKLATRKGLRDAINDLQEFAESNGDVDWDRRSQDIGNFDAIDNILRGKKYTGDMTPPDVVDWLDENVSSEFDGVEVMRAYQALSEADKWLAMTNETQNYSWWRYAGTIAEEVAEMRLTEPYDWISKSYPLSRRQTTPNPKSDTPEAVLYRELKEVDIPGYRASFNFTEFRNVILPLLQDLDEEERMFICLSESLPTKCVELLGIDPDEYQDWRVTETDNEPEDVGLGDFTDDTPSNSSEEPSLFDF